MADDTIGDGYVDSGKRLYDAAVSYRQAHPEAMILIRFPPWFDSPSIMPIGDLDVIASWCVDAESRKFIEWLDSETGHECTVMQFKLVVLPLLKRAMVSGGGDA